MSKQSAQNKELYKNLIARGYIEFNSTLYSPLQIEQMTKSGVYTPTNKNNRLKGLKIVRNKTGWVDDTLNIKNKANSIDPFITQILRLLGLIVWPEFYFLTDKQYRFDYAIPTTQDNLILKIAIEVNGGIWARGASGHSSGTGIQRDMHKSTRAALNGWLLIQVQPAELCSEHTLNMIRQAVIQRINAFK